MTSQLDPGLEVLLRTLQEETGLQLEPDQPENRFRIQKCVYLLGQLNDYPSSRFRFDNYARGPYSRELAKMYDARLTWDEIPHEEWTPKPEHLNTVSETLERGTTFLDAAVTIHSIVNSNPDSNKQSIIEHASHLEPDFESEFDEAWSFLEEQGLLDSR